MNKQIEAEATQMANFLMGHLGTDTEPDTHTKAALIALCATVGFVEALLERGIIAKGPNWIEE